MAFFRAMMIIAALILGWVALRTETSAHTTPVPAAITALGVQAAP